MGCYSFYDLQVVVERLRAAHPKGVAEGVRGPLALQPPFQGGERGVKGERPNSSLGSRVLRKDYFLSSCVFAI